MATLTISETGIAQFPPSILKILGIQKGGTLDIFPTATGVTLTPTQSKTPTTAQQKIIDEKVNQGFGMVKIDPKNAPKQNLMDFNVADHIRLFDNMGDE